MTEKRMTEEEFCTRQTELLSRVPVEFHSCLSYESYEQGHSAGREEVANILLGLVGILEKPIKDFGERIKRESKVVYSPDTRR